MYVLAKVLILFGGIIIQCETGPALLSRTQNSPIEADLQLKYISPTVESLDRSKTMKIDVNSIKANKFPKYTVLIIPNLLQNEFHECCNEGGDYFLRIGYNMKLFSRFVDLWCEQIKKIEIDYATRGHDVPDGEIYEKLLSLIEEKVVNLEELRILSVNNDEGIWKDLVFEQVEKFEYLNLSKEPNTMNLGSIFPNLKSVKLSERVDAHCLNDVQSLIELELHTSSIGDDKLISIIGKNKQLTKIHIMYPRKADVMKSIACNLENLKTLEVIFPSEDFLFKTNKQKKIYKLQSVENFKIRFFGEKDLVFRDLSFEMPNLNNLTLCGAYAPGISNFIQHFKNSKLELFEID